MNNQRIKKEIQRKIRKYFETNKNKNPTYYNYYSKHSMKGDIYSENSYLKERKDLNNFILYYKEIEREEETKATVAEGMKE